MAGGRDQAPSITATGFMVGTMTLSWTRKPIATTRKAEHGDDADDREPRRDAAPRERLDDRVRERFARGGAPRRTRTLQGRAHPARLV